MSLILALAMLFSLMASTALADEATPTEDTHAKMVGFNLYDMNGTVTSTLCPTELTLEGMTAVVQVEFDAPITIVDPTELRKELSIMINSSTTEADNNGRSIEFSVNASNNKILDIIMVTSSPQAGSTIKVKPLADDDMVQNLTSSGQPVEWGIHINAIQPTGLALEKVNSTTGTSTEKASATYRLSSLPLVRSMNFLQATSTVDGATTPIEYTGSTGSSNYFTVHSHSFFSMYASDYITSLASDANIQYLDAAGYILEMVDTGDSNNPQFKLTAKTAVEGQTLDWNVYCYPYRANANEQVSFTGGSAAVTGTDVSMSLSELSGTIGNWYRKVTAITISTETAGALKNATPNKAGDTPAAGEFSIVETVNNNSNATSYSLKLLRDEDNPIITPPATASTLNPVTYNITFKADGYDDFTTSFKVTNYATLQDDSSAAFQLRYVDLNGNVTSTKDFSWTDLETLMAGDGGITDGLYNSICSMVGLRTFKASGVKLSKLMSEAGITSFDDDKDYVLQLRTGDKVTESNPLGYYTPNGTFEMKNHMKERYSFPDIYTDNDLKNTLLAGGNSSEATRQALGESTLQPLEPMLALEYTETIYKSNQTEPTNNYSKLTTQERALRYLFGMAVEDSVVANEATTFSVSYCSLGMDVIETAQHAKTVNVANGAVAIGKTITLAIEVLPENSTDKSVTWSSSDETIASVDSVTGAVTGISKGTATITVTANDNGGMVGTATVEVTQPVESITITPANQSIYKGETIKLTANAVPSIAENKDVTWSTMDTKVATVNASTGVVTGIGKGTATITATAKDGSEVVGSTKVTVKQQVTGISLSKTSTQTLKKGKTLKLKATLNADADDLVVTWRTTKSSVAKLSSTTSKSGKEITVTAKSKGEATITATAKGNASKKASMKVVVKNPVSKVSLNKKSKTLNVGQTHKLNATVTPKDAYNSDITWFSSKSTVAKVSKSGKVTAKKTGTAIITAKNKDTDKKATCKITVKKK